MPAKPVATLRCGWERRGRAASHVSKADDCFLECQWVVESKAMLPKQELVPYGVVADPCSGRLDDA